MATSVVEKAILAVVYFKNKSIKYTVNCCIMNMHLQTASLPYSTCLGCWHELLSDWKASGRYLWTHTLQNRVFVQGDFNLRLHPNRCYYRLRKVFCGFAAITSNDIMSVFVDRQTF